MATLPPAAGGNVYDKYRSRHPVERRLVRGFCDELERLAIDTGARDVHSWGAAKGSWCFAWPDAGCALGGPTSPSR